MKFFKAIFESQYIRIGVCLAVGPKLSAATYSATTSTARMCYQQGSRSARVTTISRNLTTRKREDLVSTLPGRGGPGYGLDGLTQPVIHWLIG